MRPLVVIPIYDHGETIREVVQGVRAHGLETVVVDDGSGQATRRVLRLLCDELPDLVVLRHTGNRGKGEALKTGFRHAGERGFSHVIHLDADGQHDPADLPEILRAMRANPDAIVLGRPVFDDTVPRARLYGRQLSRGLVWLATASLAIDDPLCGYRGIPVPSVLSVIDSEETGSHMEFEPEIAVRMVWAGTPVVNVPTRVVYPPGGLSHFGFWKDWPRLALLYVRLIAGMPRRLRALRGWSRP